MNALLMPPPISVRANDDSRLFEIIDGQEVELPPMSYFACLLASRMFGELYAFLAENSLGEPVQETLFHLPGPNNRNRRPDLAFVSYERWPIDKPKDQFANAWDVVPDLAVEVVSPNDLAEELHRKIQEYFQAGVRQVWVVYPRSSEIVVHPSLNQSVTLKKSDTLDGGEILPGFSLPLAKLFRDAYVSHVAE